MERYNLHLKCRLLLAILKKQEAFLDYLFRNITSILKDNTLVSGAQAIDTKVSMTKIPVKSVSGKH